MNLFFKSTLKNALISLMKYQNRHFRNQRRISNNVTLQERHFINLAQILQ